MITYRENFLSLYYKINSASTTKRVIKCSDILSKCALVDTNDKQFLIDYLYEREHDWKNFYFKILILFIRLWKLKKYWLI